MSNRKFRRARKALSRGAQARTPRRRLVFTPKPQKHLLLAGTALVTGVVAGGFLLAVPGVSYAQTGQCGDSSGNEVTCSGNFPASNNGVSYVTGSDSVSGNLTVNLEDAEIADDADVADLGALSVDLTDGGSIVINGRGFDNEIIATGVNGVGLRTVEDGDITVNGIGGEVISTDGFVGISAVTEDGDIDVTLDDGDSVSSWGTGVNLITHGGNITALNNGTIDATTASNTGGHGIQAQIQDGTGTITITNNSLASIHADEDGIHADANGGTINITNGDGQQPFPDGLIDVLGDGIWAEVGNAGNIFEWNGTTSDSNSQIYAGGEYGMYGRSFGGPPADGVEDGEGHVEAYNFGLVEVWEDSAVAGVHVETTEDVNGYAAAFNGAALFCDTCGSEPFNINARINAYDLIIDDSDSDPYNWTVDTQIHNADGIETFKFGGVFYQTALDEKSYVPNGYDISTGELLSGFFGGLLYDAPVGPWFGEIQSPFPVVRHSFSTLARNYGTWDFTGDDNYLTPGFKSGGSHVGYGYEARTIGGVFAPGRSAWENINGSNANSGLWNYGTMIGEGTSSWQDQKNASPVLDIHTRHFDRNADSLDSLEDGSGIPNFVYIYNAGYMPQYPAYQTKVVEEAYGEASYGLEDYVATYGVIGSKQTPDNWQFSPEYAFNTNFGFQSPTGVDWNFIDNTLLYDGQLERFADAAGDRLLEAQGLEDGLEDIGGAGILMVNNGLKIGTIKESIHEDADVLGLGALIHGGQEDFGLSSLHFNTGTWFTQGWNSFGGVNDVYINLGLIQAAFRQYEDEWTKFKDLEYSVNFGVISLLDGSWEDRLKFGGDYFGGLGFLLEYAPSVEDGPEWEVPYDLSFLKRGYFALDAFLTEEFPSEGPDPAADLFKIKGYLGGQTGLIIRNANEDGSQGVNQEGIPVVAYNEVGILGGIGCASYDEAVCREGDTVFISSMSPNYNVEGDIPVIVDGLYDWTLWHESLEDNLQVQEVKGWEDINGHFELRSDYGGNSARLPGVLLGGQLLWYELLAISNRFRELEEAGGSGADLNADFAVADYGAPASPGTSSALWAKASGSWIETDTSLTQGVTTYDTSFDQDIYSILGGADMKPGGADSPFLVGLFGGYVTSDVDFNAGAPGTSVDYEGGSFGAYAAYTNGGFYVDATFKGEYLDTTYTLGGGFGDVNTDLLNLGVMANTGYRVDMGSAFVEPIASVAYVNTSVDDGSNNGTSVDFSNGTSFRAGAGARVGASMATGSATTEISLLGKIWNEFEGDNTVTVSDGVTTQSFTDDVSGVFGEAEATVTVTNADGTLSGFLSGGGKWGEHWDSWNAQVGIRKGF